VTGDVLGLFAKAPLPGLVKTRLCPPLSPAGAAELYAAMLLDVLEQHSSESQRALVLWYSPETALDWFRAQVPAEYRLEAQLGKDLATRMAHLFRTHAREGFERIVLRGTDSPTLPRERVEQAFEALEQVDLVLCPDLDGGYNLIGLREPCDSLFALEMSTASVLDATLAHARAAGLRVRLLEPHHDVDTGDDLLRLADELRGASAAARAPRTAHWLKACFAA
jgi:rSAM/selenodomain-associated transferase 1